MTTTIIHSDRVIWRYSASSKQTSLTSPLRRTSTSHPRLTISTALPLGCPEARLEPKCVTQTRRTGLTVLKTGSNHLSGSHAAACSVREYLLASSSWPKFGSVVSRLLWQDIGGSSVQEESGRPFKPPQLACVRCLPLWSKLGSDGVLADL